MNFEIIKKEKYLSYHQAKQLFVTKQEYVEHTSKLKQDQMEYISRMKQDIKHDMNKSLPILDHLQLLLNNTVEQMNNHLEDVNQYIYIINGYQLQQLNDKINEQDEKIEQLYRLIQNKT